MSDDKEQKPPRPPLTDTKHLCPRCLSPMKLKSTGWACYRKGCRTGEIPVPYLYDLWKHMADNHGLTLLESELWEIVLAVRKTDVGRYCKDIFLRDDVVRCALEAMGGPSSSVERAKFTELLLKTMNERLNESR